MSKSKFRYMPVLIGSATAFVVGASIARLLNQHRRVNPQSVLARVRRSFEEDGPVEGAWIESHTESLKRFGLNATVYYGGITRYEQDELIQYEFIADAYTGTIIDIYRR